MKRENEDEDNRRFPHDFLLLILFAFICLQTNANKREENDDERSVS
jgi:hypothetical protein